MSLSYLERMRLRVERVERKVPEYLGFKREIRNFARYLGVRMPELYFYGDLNDINFDELPDEFVVKPEFASTSIGVRLVSRERGAYVDAVSGDRIDLEVLWNDLLSVRRRYFGNDTEGNFCVEEMLRDTSGKTPPADVRFYTFQGEVGLVMMEDHLGVRPVEAMYFDGDFTPFSDIHDRYGVAEKAAHLESIVEARIPEKWRQLRYTAMRISMAVPSPFVRVDLYSTPRGVYLGELTFCPGTFYYGDRKLMSDVESARLGRLWDEAELRLRQGDGLDGSAGGA